MVDKLWGVWNFVMRKQAEDWTYLEFKQDQVPDGVARTAIAPNEGYMSVILRSMRIVNVRKGISKFYGAVQSWIAVPQIGQGLAEFQVVSTPSELKNVDAANLDRVLTMDQRILGPIPYRGGDLRLELGLFSIRSADLAGPFLDILTKMSEAAGVSYVTAALPFVQPIKDGINLLAGADKDSILEIGISRAVMVPQTGYSAVIRAPRGTIDGASLRVAQDRRLQDQQGAAIRNYPYIVWSVEITTHRPDWFLIPELKKAYEKLNECVRNGQEQAVNDASAAFRSTTLTCSDLLFNDAQTIVDGVQQEVQVTMKRVETAGPSDPAQNLRPLQELAVFSES
jgi:hypothetical protein